MSYSFKSLKVLLFSLLIENIFLYISCGIIPLSEQCLFTFSYAYFLSFISHYIYFVALLPDFITFIFSFVHLFSYCSNVYEYYKTGNV